MSHALTTPITYLRRKAVHAVRKSVVHRFALVLVWLTVASSCIVFSEPAPVDVLNIGLFVLLPAIGLVAWKPALTAGFSLWIAIAAFGYLSAIQAPQSLSEAIVHNTVSFYLYGSCFVFALFVAKRPGPHTALILNAMLTAAVFAALLGIIGYLNLIPGTIDLFTRYGRASAAFKDPNVYGPFLITGLITALHMWLTRPLRRGFVPLILAAILTIGLLFSFSRGAWAAAAIAISVYSYLYMLTAGRNLDRFKLPGLVISGAAVLGLILAAAQKSDAISRLLEERAALTQSYDVGPEGRFGGQEKAIDLILENPLGIGSHQFSPFYHHEEAHNVYLSMLLNTGWPGGFMYLIVCAATLALGFGHALRNTATRPLFLIVYAAVAANILEGVLIDSDHWRHFYVLLGIVWGLMAGDVREIRKARIVADYGPLYHPHSHLTAPVRRAPRILGPAPHRMPSRAPTLVARVKPLPPQRAARIRPRDR